MPLSDVAVPRLELARFRPLIGEERLTALEQAAAATRTSLGGRTLWNVNATAAGGGVAEMLQVLVGYALGAGLDVRWSVLSGDQEFFAITKRLHNRIHGAAGDGRPLGTSAADHFAEVGRRNAAGFLERARPGDVALLHDPQTAALVAPLERAGVHVVWRCHIGADVENDHTEEAWRFLLPHLEPAEHFVFSRAAHVPRWVPAEKVSIIPPSIDPFSPKNQDLPDDAVRAILAASGLVEGPAATAPTFVRRDGTTATVTRAASVVGDPPPLPPDVPVVVQVSRWDRLKDMQGVMEGFARHVAGRHPAHLLLVGPDVAGVSDDPEGAAVLDECAAAWRSLPATTRAAIRLVTLPMADVDENAAMVNAIQRHAEVVVQKSLAEGFGLTVAEGMWKGNPVVASRVGGIADQVVDGTGVLVDDPRDLDAFGSALVELLRDPARIERLGAAARRHVHEHFLGDRHLLQYERLLRNLVRSEHG